MCSHPTTTLSTMRTSHLCDSPHSGIGCSLKAVRWRLFSKQCTLWSRLSNLKSWFPYIKKLFSKPLDFQECYWLLVDLKRLSKTKIYFVRSQKKIHLGLEDRQRLVYNLQEIHPKESFLMPERKLERTSIMFWSKIRLRTTFSSSIVLVPSGFFRTWIS